MVAPGLAVTRLGLPPGRAIVLAGGTAATAGAVGVYGAHLLGTAAGASVALALCLLAVVTWRPRQARRAEPVAHRH